MTIEPTEEQKQAAKAFSANCLVDYSHAIARLLAEREAKLREEVLASYKGPIGHIRYMHDSDVMKLRARVAELGERSKVDAKNFYALADENAALLDREAQHLEAKQARLKHLANDEVAACGAHIDSLEKLNATYRATEAQHLADIKALMVALDDLVLVSNPGMPQLLDISRDAAIALRKRLAHYDDAKADAPASTAGFHTDNEMSDSYVPRGKVSTEGEATDE